MSTTSIPLQLPSNSNRKPWLIGLTRVRFTLRELLLLMLACAMFAAWVRGALDRGPSYRPTKMADYFSNELPRDVAAVQAALGEDGQDVLIQASKAPPFTMDQMGDANGGKSAHRHWWCTLSVPWSQRAKFRDDLNNKIRSHLHIGRPDESVWDTESVAEVGTVTPDYCGTFTRYHCGEVQGIIRFYVVRTGEDTAHLFATLDEQL
jgi:hypothetical protein